MSDIIKKKLEEFDKKFPDEVIEYDGKTYIPKELKAFVKPKNGVKIKNNLK